MHAKPTLRARLLGRELRRVREAAGLTVAELAARTGQCPQRLQRLEDGAGDSPAHEQALWCSWGAEATSVINILCRVADRIDLFAPSGIHPALAQLGRDRCTAYVLEGTEVDRTDVTVRVIPHSAHPGVEQPLTRFTLADGPAVVLYAYLHGAMLTDDPQHLRSAYALFERLADMR